MRKTIASLVVIGLAWLGYVSWPLYDLSALVRAIDARDVSTVVRYVNFDRLRTSFTEQIVSAYMRRAGVRPSLLGQEAALFVAEPVITKLVSPEAFSKLLAAGWPVGVVPDPPPSGTVGISTETLGSAWQIFAASHYGIGRFEVSAPTALPAGNRFRLTFQPVSWRWQLVGVVLPENVQNLLADEVIKAMRERK